MRRRYALLLFCLVALPCSTAQAEAPDPAKLAPETAVFYAELANPGPLVELALSEQTRQLLENVEGYQKYLRSDQYQQLQAVVDLLQTRLHTTWDAAIRELLGGGAVFFDPASNGGILAVRSRDRDLLARLNSALAELIEADDKAHGRPSRVKSKEYRGYTGWTFGGDEAHMIVDDLLLISNKSEVLKAAIDRYLDAGMKSLADAADFAQARSKQPAGAIGWSWLNLAAVRQDAKVQQALEKRSNNPVVELLLAGVIDAIKQAPYVSSSIAYDGRAVKLRAEAPRPASATSASRAWFFAPRASEAAIVPPGAIGTFTLFRDLAGLWLARDELFDEATVAQFAQADTQLGLFFSGRDFGPEVLGELDAPVQLIVARQEYAADKPTPALKLPAFGLVFKLKHPDDFAPQLLMTYQKTIGIANLAGGQQGKPQLLLSTEEHQGATISKATYLGDPKAPRGEAPPHYNFSPACARVGDHFVFGSTVGIVRQAVDALQQARSANYLADNTALTIEAAPLAAILGDNQELLIAQNMLAQGHNRPEAETAVQGLLHLLEKLDRFVLRLADEPSALAIEATLQMRK